MECILIKTLETADCPVCGNELFHTNITGDINTEILSSEHTIEPYKIECAKTSKQ